MLKHRCHRCRPGPKPHGHKGVERVSSRDGPGEEGAQASSRSDSASRASRGQQG